MRCRFEKSSVKCLRNKEQDSAILRWLVVQHASTRSPPVVPTIGAQTTDYQDGTEEAASSDLTTLCSNYKLAFFPSILDEDEISLQDRKRTSVVLRTRRADDSGKKLLDLAS